MKYLPVGVLVALIVVVEIVHVVWFKSQGVRFLTAPAGQPADYSNTKELGAVLYTEHVYAFEIAAVVLLLAIVAAITLTMRKRPGLKVQDIAKQVAVRREDRVRIVKVETSKES
jgi:NADH-quinone oxidoreductase subunit J